MKFQLILAIVVQTVKQIMTILLNCDFAFVHYRLRKTLNETHQSNDVVS